MFKSNPKEILEFLLQWQWPSGSPKGITIQACLLDGVTNK
jgi:hypothetical protein